MPFTTLPYGVCLFAKAQRTTQEKHHGNKNLQDVQPIELTVEHGIAMASSLQVAKHFEKDHNQVLRKIQKSTQKSAGRKECVQFYSHQYFQGVRPCHAARPGVSAQSGRIHFACNEIYRQKGAGVATAIH
jgi:hypothetical protein